MAQKYVIIGGDAAGMSAASKIKRLQPDAEMIVFEKGQFISFAACGIPYWISGVIDDGDKLQVLTPQIAREKRGIDVRTEHEVMQIDPLKNQILVSDLNTGESFTESYDSLLIATGASPVLPPIPGVKNEGVFTVRNLADGQRIIDFLSDKGVKHATIIGAGYIGLEMTEAFRHREIEVSLVEMADQVAPTFDKEILETLRGHLLEKGVDLRLSTMVKEIEAVGKGLKIQTSSGPIETDIVIVAAGVKPNSELAVEAGIITGKSGAITVNEYMQSSITNIYAAGDCAENRHIVLNENVWVPLAPSASKGGRIAGENMAGKKNRFPGILGTAVAKVFDFTIAQTGLTEKQAKQAPGIGEIESIMIKGGSRAHYYPGSTPVIIKLVVEKETKKLLGAQMLGESGVAKRLDVFVTAITAKMTVEDIGHLDLSYAPPVAPVYDPILVAANVANK